LQPFPAAGDAVENGCARHLCLESTLQELSLSDFQVEVSVPGKEVAQRFQDNSLLPGVILTEQAQFVGMISRRRFLEQKRISVQLYGKFYCFTV
jgi:hypothetical protein